MKKSLILSGITLLVTIFSMQAMDSATTLALDAETNKNPINFNAVFKILDSNRCATNEYRNEKKWFGFTLFGSTTR